MARMDIQQRIGQAALLEQTAEECSELAQAALKMARAMRGENPTPKPIEELKNNLNEEAADVRLCIQTILNAGLIDKKIVSIVMQEKRKRWEERLNGRAEN